MKASVFISLDFTSKRQMATALKSLKPETKSFTASLSKVQLMGHGSRLILLFEARKTSALRAAINSHLHWISLIRDIYDFLEFR